MVTTGEVSVVLSWLCFLSCKPLPTDFPISRSFQAITMIINTSLA